jgi:tetratricopeptide (TPR) repeat protein
VTFVLQLDQTQPFYIVELGTGSGKFSYYFLKALAENQDILDFPMDKIRYIMTDFTQQNFNFWKTHPALQPFVERGIVDFAIFDATKDQELHLYNSGQVISQNSLKNPICIIANYLFDTLYHDLFQVDQGMLKEGLVSVGSKRAEEPDPLDPEIIKRLSNEFRFDRIDETYYGKSNPHLNNILKWYHEYYEPTSSGATILLPIGAIGAIERLGALANDRVVVLSGDKGNNNPDHFRGCSQPHIAVHGSFSVMVNYHAIGLYFASRGGYAMHSPQEEASLKVSLFSLHPPPPFQESIHTTTHIKDLYGNQLDRVLDTRSRMFPHTRAVFQDEIVAFGPNEFFVIQKSIKEDSKTPSLKSVLALLKLSLWDPDVFYKFREVLLDQTPTCPPKVRKDIKQGIPFVWKNYYALDKEKDVAFEIGRLYYGMHDYENALAFYLHSTKEMGKHHVTCHNMGLCYYSKSQLEEAAKCFEEAYGLNPSYQKAATWLHRVQKELGLIPSSPKTPSSEGIQNSTSTLLSRNDDQQISDDLLVQQIELVLSDHEEETARPNLQRLTLLESPTRRNLSKTSTTSTTTLTTN